MLRINLLPSWVAQRRITKTLWGGAIAAFVIVTAVLVAWDLYLGNQVGYWTDQANKAQQAHTAIDDLNTQASSIKAQVQPILDKVTFYNNVMTSNTEVPDLYYRVARWTSPAIYYTDMSASGNMLDIKGYTKSIADLNRYLQYMYTEPDVQDVSLVTALPTFSQAMTPVTLYKGQPISGFVQQGAGPQAGPGRGVPNFGPQPSVPDQAALMDPGLQNAILTGQGTTTGYVKNDSFTFEVQCTLKKPLTVPGDPASGGGGAGAAGAGAGANAMGG